MRFPGYIFLFLFVPFLFPAQTLLFKENAKWGIKENDQNIIPAIYDTVFNFDETGQVCLGCHKIRIQSANKFIKSFTTNYSCNYLNKKNTRLRVKTEENDTCSVFSLGKNTGRQFSENAREYIVSSKNKKYVVGKDFRQKTFKGYHDIALTVDPGFYATQQMAGNENVYAGLINSQEKEVIPHRYSQVKINPVDSLLIACSAGLQANSEDDIYDYSGNRLAGYRRHVEMATRHFVVHKIFEPKEFYILYNIETKEEKTVNANEVYFYEHDEILIRIRNDWYVYDLKTNKKKPKQL